MANTSRYSLPNNCSCPTVQFSSMLTVFVQSSSVYEFGFNHRNQPHLLTEVSHSLRHLLFPSLATAENISRGSFPSIWQYSATYFFSIKMFSPLPRSNDGGGNMAFSKSMLFPEFQSFLFREVSNNKCRSLLYWDNQKLSLLANTTSILFRTFGEKFKTWRPSSVFVKLDILFASSMKKSPKD